MHFSPTVLTEAERALRDEVRAFVRGVLPRGTYRPALGNNSTYSPEFSLALAERGWVGMAIPVEYGGHGRSAVDRFIVAEELLSAGAPVAAHWVADRQTAPTLLAFGTEEQRRRFLPSIASGRCHFSIGMSEPGAGSDLASVTSRATKAPGGWLLNGTKIWTGGAHRNHYFCVLCRTSELAEDRHNGLSQLIVDLASPGITLRPMPLLDGTHLFNEVTLTDVFVPDDFVLGEVGMGWHQVTSELAYERSGPDRYLSSYQVLECYVHERLTPDPPSDVAERIGALTSRLWALRQCSLSVTRSIEGGRPSAIQTSIAKDLGTVFEQEIVATIQELLEDDPDPAGSSLFESLLAQATLLSPAFTIRGGTTEILRTVAARALLGTR